MPWLPHIPRYRRDGNRMSERRVAVDDLMQTGYVYYCTEPVGRNFDSDFKPELTPKEMLELGVFGGQYMTDCRKEFPASWFKHAKLSHSPHDPELNFFKITASQPLSVWRQKGCFSGPMTRDKFRSASSNPFGAQTWKRS